MCFLFLADEAHAGQSPDGKNITLDYREGTQVKLKGKLAVTCHSARRKQHINRNVSGMMWITLMLMTVPMMILMISIMSTIIRQLSVHDDGDDFDEILRRLSLPALSHKSYQIKYQIYTPEYIKKKEITFQL